MAPLDLRWTDLITMGVTGKRLARPECQVHLDAAARAAPGMLQRPMVAGRLKLGSFGLFGEQVGYGFDMKWGKEGAFHGPLDLYQGPNVGLEELRLTPELYLPDPWQRAIDTATYPAVLVGGAAIGTWVVIEMLRSAR